MRRVSSAIVLLIGCTIPDEDLVGTRCSTTCGGSLVCVNGTCRASNTSGGSAGGGLTAGGSTAGGSTAGGSTAGGSTAGGSTAGGSTAGGSTAGGSTAGGSTAGGSTAGGSTAGGSTCALGQLRCAGAEGSPLETCESGSWARDQTCSGVCVDGGLCQRPPAIAATAVAWFDADFGYTFDAGVTGTPTLNHCAWLNRTDSGVTGSCLANGHACIPPALIIGEPAANGHRLLGFDALLPRNDTGTLDPGNCIGLRGQPALEFHQVDYAIVIVERHGNDPTWHRGVDGGPRSSNYGYLFMKENATGAVAHPYLTANSNEFIGDGGTYFVGGSTGSYVLSSGAGFNDQRLRVVTLWSNGGTISLRVNGVVVASRYLPDAGAPGDATPVTIGGRGTDWARLHGAIGEVLAFKRTLNEADLESVETYLKLKFAIP